MRVAAFTRAVIPLMTATGSVVSCVLSDVGPPIMVSRGAKPSSAEVSQELCFYWSVSSPTTI